MSHYNGAITGNVTLRNVKNLLEIKTKKLCSYLGHYLQVGCVRLCSLRHSASSPQTGFHCRLSKLGISSSDSGSDSAVLLFRLSLFTFSESISRPLISLHFLFGFFGSPPICFWPLAHCSDTFGLTPNSLSCDYLVCFPLGCLPICPSLYIFCFSLCLLRA